MEPEQRRSRLLVLSRHGNGFGSMFRRTTRGNQEHRTRGAPQDTLGHATQREASKASAAMSAHHDKVGVNLLRDDQNPLRDILADRLDSNHPRCTGYAARFHTLRGVLCHTLSFFTESVEQD